MRVRVDRPVGHTHNGIDAIHNGNFAAGGQDAHLEPVQTVTVPRDVKRSAMYLCTTVHYIPINTFSNCSGNQHQHILPLGSCAVLPPSFQDDCPTRMRPEVPVKLREALPGRLQRPRRIYQHEVRQVHRSSMEDQSG
jgi:hypothetical protein